MTRTVLRRRATIGSVRPAPAPDPGPMLRFAEVVDRTSLSESCLRRLIAAGVFPPFLELGPRARGLTEYTLDAWLAQCLQLRASMRRLLDPVEFPPWRGLPPVAVPARGIQMLRRGEVEALVGLRKSAIFRRIGAGEFPAPAPLSERVRRWAHHEIVAWIRERRYALHVVRSADAPWVVDS